MHPERITTGRPAQPKLGRGISSAAAVHSPDRARESTVTRFRSFPVECARSRILREAVPGLVHFGFVRFEPGWVQARTGLRWAAWIWPPGSSTRLAWKSVARACSRARVRAGISSATRMAMIATTTSTSMSVNPARPGVGQRTEAGEEKKGSSNLFLSILRHPLNECLFSPPARPHTSGSTQGERYGLVIIALARSLPITLRFPASYSIERPVRRARFPR